MTNNNYAFIKNNKVVYIAVFDDPTEELLLLCIEHHNLDQIVEATEFAEINGTYDGKDFIPVPLFNSWIWNKKTKQFDAPIAKPVDNNYYSWKEETQEWVLETIGEATNENNFY